MQSEVLITSAFMSSSGIMMAPDGKIYLTKEMKDSLSVIHDPSQQGLACNFEDNVIYLEGHIGWYGLPQFLLTYYVYIHGNDTCEGETISFSASIWPQYDSLAWNFGDTASGMNNFSNLETPDHTYQTAGTYNVRLIVHHLDNRLDTGWLVVHVHELPAPLLGSDKTICEGDSDTFTATPVNGGTAPNYQWKVNASNAGINNAVFIYAPADSDIVT